MADSSGGELQSDSAFNQFTYDTSLEELSIDKNVAKPGIENVVMEVINPRGVVLTNLNVQGTFIQYMNKVPTFISSLENIEVNMTI